MSIWNISRSICLETAPRHAHAPLVRIILIMDPTHESWSARQVTGKLPSRSASTICTSIRNTQPWWPCCRSTTKIHSTGSWLPRRWLKGCPSSATMRRSMPTALRGSGNRTRSSRRRAKRNAARGSGRGWNRGRRRSCRNQESKIEHHRVMPMPSIKPPKPTSLSPAKAASLPLNALEYPNQSWYSPAAWANRPTPLESTYS